MHEQLDSLQALLDCPTADALRLQSGQLLKRLGFENWIYNVWYGVWVDKAALSGSCKVTIDYVHASPACGGSNSVDVVPCPCN